MAIYRRDVTGSGPIADGFVASAGRYYRLVSVTVHLNAAPTTSENLTITLDATDGPEHDAVLYSVDLAAGAVTDLVWQPDGDFYLIGGDGVDVAWANTNGRTWGLLITVQEVH